MGCLISKLSLPYDFGIFSSTVLFLRPKLVCIAEYRVSNTENAKKFIIAFLTLTPFKAVEFGFPSDARVFLITAKGKSEYNDPFVDAVSAVASFLHHFRARS